MTIETTGDFKTDECIDSIINIFYVLSDNMYSSWEIIRGKRSVYPLASDTMMSAQNTLKSVRQCLNNGAISDANVLIRKYRDDIMQYLFILEIVLKEDTSNSKHNIDDITDQDVLNALYRFQPLGEQANERERLTEAWANNSLQNEKHRRKFFDASKYEKNLSENEKIKYIFNQFKEWESVGDYLNNYVHANGVKYLRDNYNPEHRKNNTDMSLKAILLTTNVFLCILAILDSRYFMSSDYTDYLEVGENPPLGSRYWIAPCILDYLSDNLDDNMLNYIQKNQDVEMKLKKELYD